MRVLLVFGLLSQSLLSQAADPTVLENVNSLHVSGRTAEALEALEISNLKTEAPAPYYYNRGVLLHALTRYGLAVASFEKAKALSPGRSEVEAALQAARTELARTLGPAKLDGASTSFEKIGDEIPFDPFLVFFAGLTLLGLFVVIAQKKPWTSRVAILTGVNAALLIVFVIWRQWMIGHPAAMVVEAQTVRSGPGTDYLDLSHLDVGMKVRALEPAQGWRKIRYQKEGSMGFVPSESLLLLVE